MNAFPSNENSLTGIDCRCFWFQGLPQWYVLKVKPLENKASTLEASIQSELALIEQYENGEGNKVVAEVRIRFTFRKRFLLLKGWISFCCYLKKQRLLQVV